MNEHAQKAMGLFRSGYNCSQSVCLAFTDDFDFDQKTIAMLASPFGGGMGRQREVCGAVSGMLMIAGLHFGYYNPEEDDKKAKVYEMVQELCAKFKDENGTIICRELLGEDGNSSVPTPTKRTAEYYATRPCEQYVGYAAQLISEYISEAKA